MIGRRLSHFRILDRIGEGGMGVVYRAEDEKLQRVVALKVLPPEKLADEERRLRFVREARTAAAVTHPNIAVVHEIDEAQGVVFIAMELIEGKTLRDAIGGKPMPLREALRLGVEIAEGLSAAHQAKVIHRDLKPDNVIGTPGGHVKILDFGLAKLLEERAAIDPDEASKLATVSDEMTQAGRVLGTAAYMSPEQARGLAVDARSDLFSFGIVLYEMVTGKAPFRGTTSMDTLTAILREQPVPAVQLNPEVPAELERILGKCLEKEPGERYQDARDLVVDLRRLKRDTESQPLRKAEIMATPRTWKRIVWSAAALVVIAAFAGAGWVVSHRSDGATERPEAVLKQITGQPTENPVSSFGISPDGKYLIHGDAAASFYVTTLDGGTTEPLRLPDGLDVKAVEWSSDSTTVDLLARESGGGAYVFWSYSLLGGAPKKILDVELGDFLRSPDRNWSLSSPLAAQGRELRVLPSRGGPPRQTLRADSGEGIGAVAWSPDSRRFADVRVKMDLSEIVLETRDLDGGDVRPVLSDPRLMIGGVGGFPVAWLPGGRLVYALTEPPPNGRDANLWETRLDPVTWKPMGPPRRLSHWSNFKVYALRASADGRRLAVARGQTQWDVYIGDLDQDGSVLRNSRRFTTDERADLDPLWTPDGKAVLFRAQRGEGNELHRQDLGSGMSQAVLTGPERSLLTRVSPDGKSVVFTSSTDLKLYSIMRAPLSGGPSERVKVDASSFYFDCPSVSTAPCVLSRQRKGRLAFATFDPNTGKGHEILTLQHEDNNPWALSRDGSRVAFANDATREITIVSVVDGRRQKLQLENILAFNQVLSPPVSWSPSSDALFVSASTRDLKFALLRVDLSGRSRTLLESNLFTTSPVPSPDGKHLAWVTMSTGSNVWLFENF